jgi:cysteine-rich secretory family protein
VRGASAHWGRTAAALVGICIAVALPSSPAAASAYSDEGTLASLTNAARTSRGIRSLSTKSDLTAIAERHSRNMARNHRIFHDTNLPYEVSGWRYLGENVGRGSSARSVHNAFMNSSVHRTHILDPHYNQVGYGAVRGSDNLLYVTEVFAGRGSTSSPRIVRHTAVRRHRTSAHRYPRPTPVVKKVVPLVMPDQSVGMLIALIALDDPGPAQKYIPTGRAPP